MTGRHECDQCGTPLTGRKDKRFCDDACRIAAHRKRQRDQREASPDRVCDWCGDRIMPWRRSDTRFCDDACRKRQERALLEVWAINFLRDAGTFEKLEATPRQQGILESLDS